MVNGYLEQISKKLLKSADIEVNGDREWDIQVHDERFYEKVLREGSLGLGESYVDGWWDCKAIDKFICKLLEVRLDKKAIKYLDLRSKFRVALKLLTPKIFNAQSISKSKRVAEQHYNLGNNFYENMLDSDYMQYTCGYWKHAKNLQQAQLDKLKLICKKLQLPKKSDNKKDEILELGSGFGGFAKFATKYFNCKIISYNISKEQVAYAKNINKNLAVTTIEADYRKAYSLENKNRFDKVASIGMMEHVGTKNYKNFMKLANYSLKDKGLFLVHTIGGIKTHSFNDPWITKYIFPGGHLPSASQITKAAEPYFHLEDVQNIGQDYDKTLMAWFSNFDKNWYKFKDEYGERFYRMWKYYLLSCAGGFRSGSICLYQFVFSKGNFGKTYEGAR